MKIFLAILLGLSSPLLQSQTCLDFEDFALGTTLSGSQESISFNTTFLARPVQLPNGGTTGGIVSVGNSISALGSGQALNVNNATVEICLPGLKEVSFPFSNQGGYFNFSIDGSPVAVPNNDVGSLSLNGVDIVITGTFTNNRLTGEITLTAQNGTFGCFSVGGQELQIDDICFLTCENPSSPDSAVPGITCVEFEDLDKQGPYNPQTGYLENGIFFKIGEHASQFNNASSSPLRRAGHLGLEFHFEDAGFSIGADCWSAIKFNFYTKDAVTMTVNGVSQSAASISALNGALFGDVLLSIIPDPDDSNAGTACLTGRIEDFALSGKDFYLDHFCASDCLRDCIDFEGEAPSAKYTKGDTINEDGFTLQILDPQSNGEPASISQNNYALGGGQELALIEGELSFGKYCFRGLAFQYAQLDGGIVLTIDDNSVQVDFLSQLDQQTIEGMFIEVFVNQSLGNTERGVIRLSGVANSISILAEAMTIDRVCIDECPEPLVVGFGDEPLGEVYEDGDTIDEDNIEFEVCDLRLGDTGTATITGDNQTGGTGQAVALDFASLKFDLLCASQLTFQFANFGANGGPQGFGFDVRLTVNGDSSGLVQNFTALDGSTLGGATVSVTTSGNSGRVTLTGNIESIVVGGFNIQLDNLMQTPFVGGPQCHNFNTWDPNLTYGLDHENFVLLNDGTGALISAFIDINGSFEAGTATIGSDQNTGGSGQELTLTDATVSFAPLLGDWADVSFRFMDLGLVSNREVSLEVNGDTQNFNLITDLDDYVFQPGTDEEVTATVFSEVRDGKLVGIVKLTGIVTSLTIGGQGLVIDDVCGTQQPAPIYIDSGVVSVEQTGPNEVTYVWDVEALNAQESDFLIRRSTNLTNFTSFSGSQRNVLSHGAGTNLYRVTEVQPIDAAKRFYRVQLRSF